MNLKTTLALAVLVAAGCAFYFLGLSVPAFLGTRPAAPADAGTTAFLENELTPDRLTRIEIHQGDQRLVVLDRPRGGDWSLPGGWPTRKPEAEALVKLLTSLRSRFTPISLSKQEGPEQFGLDKPAVTVLVQLGDQPHRLRFAEKADEANRFGRPTHLRLDNRPEVLRLGPNVIAALSRPADHYQQRRLFPFERVVRDADSPEKVERLDGKELEVKGPDGIYRLVKTGDDWELAEPVKDRADPDKLRTLLTALPDLWAEEFVTAKKDGAKMDYGLDNPEQTIRVVPANGNPITVRIGKPSRTKTRKVTRPPPPGLPPGMPREPQAEIVHDEYRYAKLDNNEQVFEVKADKFKDVFVKADTLRDPRVARFRTDDVTRVEIAQGDQKVVLMKEKKKEEKDRDRWKLETPVTADAETSRVTELLDRLSNLSARDKDILDKADPEEQGLKPPAAVVTLTLEESPAGARPSADGADKPKKTRALAFSVGKPEKEKGDKPKLYVQVAGWDRVNAVEDAKDELLKLLQRRAIAYRGRRVLDFNTGDVAKLEIKRPGETYTLEKEKDAWRLTAPVKADADTGRANNLTDDLSRLEVVEFVEEPFKAEELDTKFGLSEAATRATMTFTDKERKPQTLVVGKQREGKTDYYAKLEDGAEVFVVGKSLRDDLDRESLAYRPLDLWKLEAEDIAEVRVRRGDEEHRLKRDGTNWRVAEPFEAPVPADHVKSLAEDLARPRAERYVVHAAKDLKEYGLDPPALRLTLVPTPKKPADKDKANDQDAPKERTLLIGKVTEKDPKARYAKLADGDAVFVLGAKVVAAADRGALDLLDKTLLSFDRNALNRIQREGTGEQLTFQRDKDEWRLVEGPAAPFTADRGTADALVTAVCPLLAARFVAYGPKADLAKYGLDKPTYTVTITGEDLAKGGEKPKPIRHVLKLGKEVEGTPGEFYARLDDGPAVFVLPASDGKELVKTHLDYVDRTLLDLKPDGITGVQRRMGGDALEVAKKDGTWQVVQPADWRADEPTLQRLADSLANLKAEKVASYRSKDLKAFGLEPPAAVVTVRLAADAKPGERVLRIGKEENEKGGRFAVVEGSDTVGVLPVELSRQLTAAPAAFRDRNVARFADADRVTLERGGRKLVFTQAGGSWKLTEPVTADVEQNELEELVNAVRRLRAAEIVAEKPADLQPYGLEKPEARWRFQAGGKEMLDLLVGGPEKAEGKETPRRHAKLAGGDLVFLLDPALSRRAVAEYRSRNVWPTPLDAVQIERLTWTRDGSSFTLTKAGDTWTVAGKPDAKVNPAAIRETLDALAGLKAARYVADQGADLKLHGLEPPQVALEIQTPTAKRVLHVGRPEGESKRHYARVPDEKRTDVFVLDEQDVVKIVRTLQGFTQ